MKIYVFLPFISLLIGCSNSSSSYQAGMTDKDIESYAIASCLTLQKSTYLQDQGDAWASVIVQRMKGSIDILPKITEIVKEEISKGEMAVARSEVINAKNKELPVLYCNEIIYKPAVLTALKSL